MKYLIYTLLIFILFGLMEGLYSSIAIRGAVPNLILLLVIFFAAWEDSSDAYFIAILGGIVLDVSSALPLGSFLLGFIILVFLCQLVFSQVIFYQSQLKYLPLLVIGGQLIVFLWLWFFNWAGQFLHWTSQSFGAITLWGQFLPNLFYALLLMYPVYWLVNRIKPKLNNQQIMNK